MPSSAISLGVSHPERIEHGVPISELLRVYRLVHAGLLDQLYTETARVAGSQELIDATTLPLSAMAFEYVDRTAEQAVAAYQRDRRPGVAERTNASPRIGPWACQSGGRSRTGRLPDATTEFSAIPPDGLRIGSPDQRRNTPDPPSGQSSDERHERHSSVKSRFDGNRHTLHMMRRREQLY
ncbi:hypothetical protein [Streptomyces sp. NBC_01235]|uniref:hypothetical protein n=1 Tax=Streptomyces sp. NBC_01235 TaxID=2903788 RepID=UPI002E1559D3|nr:hypothetical protein OG289_03000 [Streptomyces sp. NBC_01235]